MDINRSSVTDLLVDYWHDVDHEVGAAAHDFYTEDGVLVLGAARFSGREEIRSMYAARAARGARVSRHLVSNVRLTHHDASAGSIRVLSSLTLHAQDGPAPATRMAPVLVADVTDRLKVVGDELRIVSRELISVFIASEDDVAVPLR